MFYAIAVVAVMWVIWNRTTLGKNMFAIGGNREAAKVCGVNVKRTIIIVYIIAGLLYAFGGVLEAGRTGSANSTMGADYAMDAIAACVVGGVSMKGGTGTLPGVVIGVIIFQIISYGLIYIGVSLTCSTLSRVSSSLWLSCWITRNPCAKQRKPIISLPII